MKKGFLFFVLVFIALSAFEGNARNLLKYQILVTDASGKPMVSAPVSLDFTVRKGEPTGEAVMSENISTVTSEAGIAYVNIGENSLYAPEDLDWAGETYFLDIKIDKGTGKESLGIAQIMSVPKAIYAESASSLLLKSPSGKNFKVTIDDNGNLTANPINN